MLAKNLQASSKLKDWLSWTYLYLPMVDYPFAFAFLMPFHAYVIREVIFWLHNVRVVVQKVANNMVIRVFTLSSTWMNCNSFEKKILEIFLVGLVVGVLGNWWLPCSIRCFVLYICKSNVYCNHTRNVNCF